MKRGSIRSASWYSATARSYCFCWAKASPRLACTPAVAASGYSFNACRKGATAWSGLPARIETFLQLRQALTPALQPVGVIQLIREGRLGRQTDDVAQGFFQVPCGERQAFLAVVDRQQRGGRLAARTHRIRQNAIHLLQDR